MNTERELKPET